MIPAKTMRSLLHALLNDLQGRDGEPDYNRFASPEMMQKRYRDFMDILQNGEDDLSIILSLVEKDPDCMPRDPIRSLQALVDYVQIAVVLYDPAEQHRRNTTLH